MDRYIDFDKARAERKQEPLTLLVYGVEYALPPAMPASLLLDMIRMEEGKQHSDELTYAEMVDILNQILSKDVLAPIVAHDDFSIEDLANLLRTVMQMYTGAASESGEAPAPNRTARRHPTK
jgi:hypothetical protein